MDWFIGRMHVEHGSIVSCSVTPSLPNPATASAAKCLSQNLLRQKNYLRQKLPLPKTIVISDRELVEWEETPHFAVAVAVVVAGCRLLLPSVACFLVVILRRRRRTCCCRCRGCCRCAAVVVVVTVLSPCRRAVEKSPHLSLPFQRPAKSPSEKRMGEKATLAHPQNSHHRITVASSRSHSQ